MSDGISDMDTHPINCPWGGSGRDADCTCGYPARHRPARGPDGHTKDAARYRALHPYLRDLIEWSEAKNQHVLRIGLRELPTGKNMGWTGEMIDDAADYAISIVPPNR